MKEFVICAVKGVFSVSLVDSKNGKHIVEIELPMLPHSLKSLSEGWTLFGGLNDDGMLSYNFYKDEYFPGVFRYSLSTIHDIIYLEEKGFVLISSVDACYNFYKFKSSKFHIYLNLVSSFEFYL